MTPKCPCNMVEWSLKAPRQLHFWKSDKSSVVAQLKCKLNCQKWDAGWWLWQNLKRRKTMRWKEVRPFEFIQWKHFPDVVSTAKSQPVIGLLLITGSHPSTWWLMSKADISDRVMFGKHFPHALALRSPADQREVKMQTWAFSPSCQQLQSSNPSCHHHCENSLLISLTLKNKSTFKKKQKKTAKTHNEGGIW